MLADVKPFNSSIDARIFHFDAAHFPGQRTLPQPRFEILQVMRRTRGVGLHAPVRQIANPALQPKLPRDAHREIAVADALDLSRIPRTYALACRWLPSLRYMTLFVGRREELS